MPAPATNQASDVAAARRVLRPLQQFAMALALYLLWGVITWLGVLAGKVVLVESGPGVLLMGIAATNAVFFSLARAASKSELSPELSPELLAGAQSVLGAGWATAFLVFSLEGGELTLGMFLCATLYALFQLPQGIFLRLALAFGGVYAAATALHLSLDRVGWQGELLSLLVYAGITGWLLVFARSLDELRQRLQERNAELRQHIRKVVRIAERDQLTKSFNRHAIMETLSREKGRADRIGSPVSVCILDLDHFKQLNDEHGHLIGDRVLKQFAKRARSELRTMDAIKPCDQRRSLGRFGGEEFIAMLPGTRLGGAAICAERIRTCAADEPFDGLYHVTISIGVAEYQRGETVEEWLARADDALYEAKAAGRNRVELSGELEEMNAEIRELRPKRG